MQYQPAVTGQLVELDLLLQKEDQDADQHAQILEERAIFGAEESRQERP